MEDIRDKVVLITGSSRGIGGVTPTERTNFQGIPPQDVADIIVKIAKGEIDAYTERDVGVRNYLH